MPTETVDIALVTSKSKCWNFLKWILKRNWKKNFFMNKIGQCVIETWTQNTVKSVIETAHRTIFEKGSLISLKMKRNNSSVLQIFQSSKTDLKNIFLNFEEFASKNLRFKIQNYVLFFVFSNFLLTKPRKWNVLIAERNLLLEFNEFHTKSK